MSGPDIAPSVPTGPTAKPSLNHAPATSGGDPS
jgi:hypothetical protein